MKWGILGNLYFNLQAISLAILRQLRQANQYHADRLTEYTCAPMPSSVFSLNIAWISPKTRTYKENAYIEP